MRSQQGCVRRIASWIARVIAWMGPQDSYLDSQTDSTIASGIATGIAKQIAKQIAR